MIDDALLDQCRRGSEPAFRTLYYRTMPRVRAWVARFIGPNAPVDDVVQDVFVQLHRSIAAFRGEAAFGTWLYRVTLNVAASHLRRAGRDERRLDRTAPAGEPAQERRHDPAQRAGHDAARDPGHDEERRLQARDDLRRLYRALDTLSPDQRAAFVLYELEGRSLQDIAAITDCPVPTAAARLRRARSRIVEVLGGTGSGKRARATEDSA
ncbi:MAG TPA: RNA polymerase sigma factor [Myxococcota bacterium]|jgi:RNA polymerase sigma-70 factor (ECF subfamily)|nr:RNA polymerase sigma factor [Myxococcota bacterium]